MALEEIKAAEQAKMQELVNKSNLDRDNTIQGLQQELKSYEDRTKELEHWVKTFWNEIKLYNEQYGGRRLTTEERIRIEEFEEQLRNKSDSHN